MITQKLPAPCLSQVFGRFEPQCRCDWCLKRRHVEWARDHSRYAEPEDVTVPYDPNLTVVLRAQLKECGA
jgi:hypothetical protein